MNVVRLRAGDEDVAATMFRLLVSVFEEGDGNLSADYIGRLLARDDFWAYVAIESDGDDRPAGHDQVVGGLTAHTLWMTRSESAEVFLYDLAVHADHRRRGVARALVSRLVDDARAAGIDTAFVPADDEDDEAIAFYRSLGATGSPVTIFDLM